MKSITFAVLLGLSGATLLASPVTFGTSWDGDPPGTFADITGATDIVSGHPDFAAGTYLIEIDGGKSALYATDTIGFEGDSVCAVSAVGCVLGKPGANQPPTVLEVYLDRPWHLWGWSAPLGKVPATGSQFAFTQTAPNTWTWGFEDLPNGDFDYQDVLGKITFLHGVDLPLELTVAPLAAAEAPEPSTWLLVGIGLVGLIASRANLGGRA
jgi:PEP-CTERM motif